MIDPVQSLSFSVQASPKVYALLLGSGVSRSAEIPTGWEIVMDLLGKLAASTGDAGVPNLEAWYVEKYQEVPDYSKILDALAKTPSERQQLLRPYFEPDDQQRQEGLKQPTAAHRAIAQLVAQGFIKVIVTTNFDRLIEKALEDEGVVPTVLSTTDQVEGALPLDHLNCCVFKVHGDYLDTRIRNTQSELDEYPQVYDNLLNRIFDEYGLIVCGWSATWDTALRNAIFRAKSRRFTTFWALYGDATDEAQQLIEQRSAQVISIEDADRFFQSVQETVTSIEEYSRPHPLSTEAAVATLKRYLSRPEHRIQLSDHINTSVEQVVIDTTGEGFELGDQQPNTTTVSDRLRRYESSCSTLLYMAAVGGYWANEGNSAEWERAIEHLSTLRPVSGSYYSIWRYLKTYPGTLLLYALGLGAVEADRLDFLNRIFKKTVIDSSSGVQSTSKAITTLLSNREFAQVEAKKSGLEGMDRRHVPLNDWIHNVLRQPLKQYIADDVKYSFIFDKFEILAALGFGSMEHSESYLSDWFPLGSFIWRSENRQRIIAEFEESINSLSNESPYVGCGIFGSNAGQCLSTIERFKNYVHGVARQMGIFY